MLRNNNNINSNNDNNNNNNNKQIFIPYFLNIIVTTIKNGPSAEIIFVGIFAIECVQLRPYL